MINLNNLYKLFLGLVVSSFLVLFSTTASNAYEALVTDGLNTHSVNVSSVPQGMLVCGEAWGNGKSWNLGCTKWIDRMTVALRSDMPTGNYSVWFTSQDSSGKWTRITSKVMITKGGTVSTISSTKTSLKHAYKPYQVNKVEGTPSNGVHARVDNFTDRSVKVTLCAEAYGSGKKWHLGCLPQKVELDKVWGGNNWAVDFNVYARPDMPSGVYSVKYTYQDEGGMWHDVMNLDTGTPVTTNLIV